jgi:signal transduction histidine kinase
VLGDSSRLRQLVTNLVDNATKFTGSGGSVTLRVERDDTRAKLIVADSGEGIPQEHLAHVFERFYQASPARSSGGSGLGLSICRWIAEAHGGDVSVESHPGSGTIFIVNLPLARRVVLEATKGSRWIFPVSHPLRANDGRG